MRIRILLVTLMRIRIFPFILMRIRILASKQWLKTLKNCTNKFIFHTFWLDQDPDPAYHFVAGPLSSSLWCDADPDPTFQFNADPCGSGSTTLFMKYRYLKIQKVQNFTYTFFRKDIVRMLENLKQDTCYLNRCPKNGISVVLWSRSGLWIISRVFCSFVPPFS